MGCGQVASQFWETGAGKPALAKISGHFETNEPLPGLLKKMLAAKNYNSAMMMLRQLEFSLFDFRLHLEYGQLGSDNPIQPF